MPSHDIFWVHCYTNRRSRLPTISFRMFPKGDLLKKYWLAAIKRDGGPSFQVTPNTVVGSAHFLQSDYSYIANCTPSSDGFSVTYRKWGYCHLKADRFFPVKSQSFQRASSGCRRICASWASQTADCSVTAHVWSADRNRIFENVPLKRMKQVKQAYENWSKDFEGRKLALEEARSQFPESGLWWFWRQIFKISDLAE